MSRPLGPPVDVAPARRPERLTLGGRFVTLEPLDAARDAPDLYAGAHGAENDQVWDYLFDGPFVDEAAFRASLEAKAASNDPLFWAIRAHGQTLGHTTLMRIDVVHGVIEIGNILYVPALQRTPGATEAFALLANYVFDTLGYRRFEWKCNALNAPSRRAAARFGFTFEGVFRQHMLVKGRNRDTAWFSMLATEWPARREALARWLAPGNFDGEGEQIHSLAMSS